MVLRKRNTDGIALLAAEVLWRLDGELVLASLHRHQSMITDKLCGVDAALQRALAGSNHAAILRPHSQDCLWNPPSSWYLDRSGAGLKMRSIQAAVNDVHWRRADKLGHEQTGGIVVDLRRRVEVMKCHLLTDLFS